MASHASLLGEEGEEERLFTERMRGTVTSGFILAGLSLGVKLGLFDILAQTETPLTSEELADKAKCKERYVREWLHHMVMSDVVDVDKTGKKFTLPVSKRRALTDRTQLVQGMGSAYPNMFLPHKELLDCFRLDGPAGLPFEAVLPFFKERTQVDGQAINLTICADTVRDTVPGLKDKLESGIHVCDIGSGNGIMIFHMASQFPKSVFTGIDTSSELLEMALETKRKNGTTNASFVLQDATDLPEIWYNTFDYVIIRDVLHDIAHVSKALKSIYRCLKPEGMMSLFELNMSRNPYDSHRNPAQKALGQMSYSISMYHCLPASLYYPDSQGLGSGPGIENIVELVLDAGFREAGRQEKTDWANVHLIFKK